MGHGRSILAATVAMLGLAESLLGTGFPPYYIQRTPELVIVDLNAGQASFECTGTAIDVDAGDTITFWIAGRQPFMTLDTFGTNPASFRLHAENLNASHYGGYLIDIIASDSALQPQGENAAFAIGIVPEPTAAGLATV